jgi:hypothetical protein
VVDFVGDRRTAANAGGGLAHTVLGNRRAERERLNTENTEDGGHKEEVRKLRGNRI